MKYGFVIDHRKCIGCHACTVACKAENDVPVGSFRTWVKYIEKGEFPNTRRYFSVMRCQHCEAAPCIEVCPTASLFKRTDGIVDFDPARCIGCKSCMQACPYDALYIDPSSHTAAKCHYCAHRVDRGLLPACVIVCPEQAIVAGDLDDPTSRIARLVAREHVQVRRPDQGTRPQVFYLGADEASITPGLAQQPPMYLWAGLGPANQALELKGALDLRQLTRQSADDSDPDGNDPPPKLATRTVYDVHHPKPWGWRVGTYLWTKAIAAGALGIAGLALGARLAPAAPLLTLAAPLFALVFIAVTAGLLIWDLKRPDRFYYILTKSNHRSWLVWGTYALILLGTVGGLWFVGGLFGSALPRLLAWPGLILALSGAGYSAFLFGQAEGRDFWQSPLLLWRLLTAATAAGAAVLLISGVALGTAPATLHLVAVALLIGLSGSVLICLADLYLPHANKDAAAAAAVLTEGPLARQFWGALVLGGLLPVALVALALTTPNPALYVGAALLGLGGLWAYEVMWVNAGQSVPIS